ncbi:MAG: hypothetical protein ACF8MF_03515 [Phycisphaerales bacterium JB052]
MQIKRIVAITAATITASAYAGEVHLSEAALMAEMSAGFTYNDFSSVSDGPVDSLDYDFGTFSYEITTGAFPTSGLHNEDGVISTASNFDSIVINFTSDNVHAIGANVWATDPDFDPAGAIMIVSLSDGTTETFPSGGPGAFYGYTSDMLITSVEIRAVGFFVPRFATMDNLYVGTTGDYPIVPLPPAAWAGLGMLGLMGARRSMKRS